MSKFTESVVEDAALAWIESLGYAVLHGPEIAAGEPRAERSDPNYRDVVLEARLRQALVRLNPALPPDAIEDAYRKLTRADAPSLSKTERSGWQWLSTKDTVTSSEYASAMGVPNRTALNHLKKFSDLGLLHREGSGTATQYKVVRT